MNGDFEFHDPLGGRIRPRLTPRRIGRPDPVEERLGRLLLHAIKVGCLELEYALDNDSVDFPDLVNARNRFGHTLIWAG